MPTAPRMPTDACRPAGHLEPGVTWECKTHGIGGYARPGWTNGRTHSVESQDTLSARTKLAAEVRELLLAPLEARVPASVREARRCRVCRRQAGRGDRSRQPPAPDRRRPGFRQAVRSSAAAARLGNRHGWRSAGLETPPRRPLAGAVETPQPPAGANAVCAARWNSVQSFAGGFGV